MNGEIKKSFNSQKGQSLVEILIALGIGGILIGAATGAVIVSLRKSLDIRATQVAASFSEEYVDSLQALGESNWLNIYNLSGKGPSSQFYLTPTSTTNLISTGTTSTVREGHTFTRYFSVENASRDSCGSGNITTNATTSCTSGPGSSGVADDPSTQKITVNTTWEGGQGIKKVQYLTRYRNRVFIQTDWSGGSGQEGPITEANNKFTSSTNINYSSSTGSIVIAAPVTGDLTSSIYDTGVASGTAINTIMWQGNKPSGTNVRFQISSNSSLTETWSYIGPDGSSATYYTPADAGIPVPINLAQHNNKRYFRYKVFLDSDATQTLSPRVDDVIINYSP